MPYNYRCEGLPQDEQEIKNRLEDYIANRPDTWLLERVEHGVFIFQAVGRILYGDNVPQSYKDFVVELTNKYAPPNREAMK